MENVVDIGRGFESICRHGWFISYSRVSHSHHSRKDFKM